MSEGSAVSGRPASSTPSASGHRGHAGHPGGGSGGHPGGGHPGHPGGGEAVPIPRVVRDAAPAGARVVSVAIAWLGSAATALLFAWLGGALDGRSSGWAAAVLLAVIAAACAGTAPWLIQRAGAEAERRLRRAVVSRVFHLGAMRTAGRSGELLSIATDAVERTAHYRAGFLGPIIGALTTPLVVLGIMALTADAVTAGWLALLILLVPVLIGGFRRLVRPIGGAYRRTQARLTSGFLEAIQALDTLVYARAAERVGADLARRGEEHRRGLMRMLAANQLLIFVVDAAFSLTIVVAATVIASLRAADGSITAGAAVAIVLMTILVIGPVDVIGQFFYIGIGGRAAQRQIAGHLADAGHSSGRGDVGVVDRSVGRRAEAGPATRLGHAGETETPGSIVLDDVTAGYGGAPVLREVSLRIGPGERVALVGPSGIGKSTVSALVQAHLRPSAGRVIVDGLDTARSDPERVRARLAVVEQRPYLFLGTIAENLRLAAPDADDGRLWEALELAGLGAEVERMPHGLDTPVGEDGALLSGGQAQRLAIARAALRDASILILDEPTSQVDLAGEAAILAALDRLARGRTVLMIAHRPGAILAADRVIELGARG